jgi:8-oxo-dGTP pyrophosphatase MutT (NUDIX family)
MAEDFYEKLPMFYAAAAVIVTDPGGRVLLAKPNYRDEWLIPGGYVEPAEYPHEAAARELREELGLSVRVGPLLVVDWASPREARPRSIVNLIFDGGVLEPPRDGFRLQREELDDARFVPVEEAARLLPPHIAPRVAAALRARESGRVEYLADAR